jgi:hypothetical protein
MKIWWFLIFLMIVLPISGLAQSGQEDRSVDYPDVPRVTAYEAYTKYKAGQAIIIQAAGAESYGRRHILGAYHVDGEALRRGEVELPNFPMEGIEIFTYCY